MYLVRCKNNSVIFFIRPESSSLEEQIKTVGAGTKNKKALCVFIEGVNKYCDSEHHLHASLW
jgi:hypothetical protein